MKQKEMVNLVSKVQILHFNLLEERGRSGWLTHHPRHKERPRVQTCPDTFQPSKTSASFTQKLKQ